MKRLLFLAAILFSLSSYAGNPDKKIAILEIVDRDANVSQGVKLMLRGRLTSAVTGTPGYVGLDRVDMDAVLAEHDFQRSGIVSEKHIKQLGVALGAEYVLVAEAAWFDSYKTEIIISAKLIDVESFRVVRMITENTLVSSIAVDEACRSLAKKLLKPANDFQQTPGSGYIPNY